MKKTAIVFLALLMACTAVFADEKEPAVRYDLDPNYALDFTFQPTLSRYNAMGQSGLALPTRMDSFYSNPAALSKRGFGLSFPSVTVTFYNLEKLVNDPEAVDIVNKIFKGKAESGDYANLASKVLKNLGTGRNLVAKIDTGFALKLGMVGFGTNVQFKFHGLNKGTSFAAQKVIPEVNAAQTIAFGIKVIDTKSLSLSVGASVHGVYKAYYREIGAETLVNLIGGDNEAAKNLMLWDTPVMGGYAIPFDIGVTLGILNDTLTFAATANNINGTYHMKSFSGMGDLVNSISANTMKPGEHSHKTRDSESFEIYTPWTLSFGVAFAPVVPVLNPVVTADLVDMLELCRSIGSSDFRWSDLLLHLNAGVEFGLFDVLTVRGGINRGYLSVGTGLNLLFMQVDLAYGWQEMGNQLGDKPVDSLTIKFSLGYDKK
jgi:hypothetical protein